MSIVGLAGSGKSTLADAISKKLSIPHIHLDRFWFEANGLESLYKCTEENREVVRAVVKQKTQAAIAADSWVSDGLYLHIQPEIAQRADSIIFLDIPLWRRLFNHVVRSFNPATRHRELSILHDIAFLFEIIRREYKTKPRLKRFISENISKVKVLRSRRDVQQFLESL